MDDKDRVKLHPAIDVVPHLMCTMGKRASIISSMKEYRKNQILSAIIGTQYQLGDTFNVELGVNAGPVTGSISKTIEPFAQLSDSTSNNRQTLENFFLQQEGKLVVIEAMCSGHIVYIGRYRTPEFRESFKASVRRLYNAKGDEERLMEFKRFIFDFGTHYS